MRSEVDFSPFGDLQQEALKLFNAENKRWHQTRFALGALAVADAHTLRGPVREKGVQIARKLLPVDLWAQGRGQP